MLLITTKVSSMMVVACEAKNLAAGPLECSLVRGVPQRRVFGSELIARQVLYAPDTRRGAFTCDPLQTRPPNSSCLCRFVEIPQGGEESQIVGKKVFGPTHWGTAFFQVMPLSGPDNMHLGASLGGRAGGWGVKLRRTSRKTDILYLLMGTPKVFLPRAHGMPL